MYLSRQPLSIWGKKIYSKEQLNSFYWWEKCIFAILGRENHIFAPLNWSLQIPENLSCGVALFYRTAMEQSALFSIPEE